MANSQYLERQKEIDSLLTPNMVSSIMDQHKDEVEQKLRADKSLKGVTIVFASTASLLRRIKGGNDKPIGIDYSTIDELLKEHPNSKTILACKNDMSDKLCFCVRIVTYLPTSVLGMGNDQILTHTLTCYKI